VKLRNKSNDAKDQFSWKWLKGDEYVHSQLGAPTATDLYAMCIYDSSASVPTLVSMILVAPGGNWRDLDPKGFKYKDSNTTSDGVQQVKLTPGTVNKAKVLFKAKGANIPMPVPFSALHYFDQDTDVIVKLVSTSGICWSSTFTAADTKKNTPSQFSAKRR